MLPDSVADDIEISPTDSPLSLVTVTRGEQTEESTLLSSTLVGFPPSLLHYVADGVLDQQGIGADGVGFRYPTDELDPDEQPFEGVDVYNPLGSVEISIGAFERLLARFLRACLDTALTRDHPVLNEPWWSDYVRMTAEIEQRVAAAPAG